MTMISQNFTITDSVMLELETAFTPGHGNPDSLLFAEWLTTIKNWSEQHKGHSPITLGIDVKGGITGGLGTSLETGLADNPSFSEGNLSFLNEELKKIFANHLFRAEDFGGNWPDVAALKDKIMVVLSGDLSTRKAYRWDSGHNPAVAINSKGQVIEVHESGSHVLWYWTGEYLPAGKVLWRRHGKYDNGSHPAVAIDDAGQVVEVHTGPSGHKIFYQTAQLNDNFELVWDSPFHGHELGSGSEPSVSFISTSQIQETHRANDGEALLGSTGILNPSAHSVAWAESKPADHPATTPNSATAGNLSIKVSLQDIPRPNTLSYQTTSTVQGRVRYEQVAFVEHQKGEDPVLLNDGALFCAAKAGASALSWARQQRENSKIVRLWQVKPGIGLEKLPDAPAQFPATDNPRDPWYMDYASAIHAEK